MSKKIDYFGYLATLMVYAGFWVLPSHFELGVYILIVSNILWVVRSIIKKDWAVMVWQAGFVYLNLRWLSLGNSC